MSQPSPPATLTLNPKRIQSLLLAKLAVVAKSQFAIIYRNVPVLLRRLRESAGLTQRDLAKKIGKTQSWVFKTESAARRIDIAEFLEWCVGCDADARKAFEELVRMRR